jgi:hypothetical protein
VLNSPIAEFEFSNDWVTSEVIYAAACASKIMIKIIREGEMTRNTKELTITSIARDNTVDPSRRIVWLLYNGEHFEYLEPQ